MNTDFARAVFVAVTGINKQEFPTRRLVSKYREIVQAEGAIVIFQWLIENIKIPKWLVPEEFQYLCSSFDRGEHGKFCSRDYFLMISFP